MKRYFIVIIVIHTSDSITVIVWIIRPPRRKAGGFVHTTSVSYSFLAWQVVFLRYRYRLYFRLSRPSSPSCVGSYFVSLLLAEVCGSRYTSPLSSDAPYFGKVFACGSVGFWFLGFCYRHLKNGIGSLIRVPGEWSA